MNIKSLLLGSAAALIAASGARAADAIDVVAEPEPAEYVRVCDTYGTGYFYIPGTETCLRIGGYARFDISGGDGEYGGITTADRMDQSESDTYAHKARLSLRTWTGSETEFGTLSTYTETRFNYTNARADDDALLGIGNSTSLNFAWIQLGGFRVGKDESAFTTFTDYAGGVIADDLIAYGPFDTNRLSYTYDAGNGISAILSLETGEAAKSSEIDSYIPYVVAGAKYAGGWGAVSGVFGYDSNYEEYAGKVRADVNVNDQISLFVMGGYGTDENVAKSYYKPWNGAWAVWGGGSYKLNPKTTFNLQGAYEEGITDANLGVAANVNYELVKDFNVTPEVTYYDNAAADEADIGGMVRFQRNF
ncbi:MAG: porin [Rhizobiaceae bacterium]|nr:porin [Rhizobiaceae bacterium]